MRAWVSCRFIGRYSHITSHSIPALSRLRRHYHRLQQHYLARAHVGAGFPHCPRVHACIRLVTPSRLPAPHHKSQLGTFGIVPRCTTVTNVLLTRSRGRTIADISWLSEALWEPTVPAFGRSSGLNRGAVEIGRTWRDCAFLAHSASIMAIEQSFPASSL